MIRKFADDADFMIWTEERKQAAREACRYWQGTPHAHWMRIHGVGVDCIHFVVDVLEKSGAIPGGTEIPKYHDNIGFKGAEEKLIKEFSDRIPVTVVDAPYEFGDILIFNPKLSINHIALFIDGMIWHSIAQQAVDVYPFADYQKVIRGAMRLK